MISKIFIYTLFDIEMYFLDVCSSFPYKGYALTSFLSMVDWIIQAVLIV